MSRYFMAWIRRPAWYCRKWMTCRAVLTVLRIERCRLEQAKPQSLLLAQSDGFQGQLQSARL